MLVAKWSNIRATKSIYISMALPLRWQLFLGTYTWTINQKTRDLISISISLN